jgi:hypothetical protein
MQFARRPAPGESFGRQIGFFAAHSSYVCSSDRASGPSDLVLSKATVLKVGSGGEVAAASESLSLRFSFSLYFTQPPVVFPCMRVKPSVLLA